MPKRKTKKFSAMKNRKLFKDFVNISEGNSREERNLSVLRAAYRTWLGGSELRRSRLRNKRFTYGDQWGDLTVDHDGQRVTEWERYCAGGDAPITNNLIRHLVKSIVGRFRSEALGKEDAKTGNPKIDRNVLNELDCRCFEEFLISGSCVQRVDSSGRFSRGDVEVRNVNLNKFFVNAISDPLCRDCEIVGELHDLSVSELLRLTAGGNRRRAEWIRSLYSDNAELRAAECATRLGADSQSGTDFWHTHGNKCRAIEVWTLESHEVMVSVDRKSGAKKVEPFTPMRKRDIRQDTETYWDVENTWHCRWFSPMGDLLTEYDAPKNTGSHPFVFKFYPLTDSEVHSMVEDVIDQQKYVNRLITLIDHILSATAKGVLLYPEGTLPDGFSWNDVRRVWSKSNGVIPYLPAASGDKPVQISANITDIGAFEMIQLQLKMLEDVSGVSGALRGKGLNTGNSAALYQREVESASTAMADVYETFNSFRREREKKLELAAKTQLSPQV